MNDSKILNLLSLYNNNIKLIIIIRIIITKRTKAEQGQILFYSTVGALRKQVM